MRAFILRRLLLISQGQGNVILLGSRHSANTLRLREFLSRNGYPYRYVDLDTDNTSQELLDRFEVTPSEIPVSFAAVAPSCAILPIKNSPIVSDSTPPSMNRKCAT